MTLKQKYWNGFIRSICVLFFIFSGISTASAQNFKQEQLDQILAPIALYPDALLTQVLMASTYPDNVAQASQWSRNNPKMQGDAAVNAVANQNWDPSVQSLVAFPQILASMGAKPDWVQQVGDAFLDQPDAVMDTIQKLRRSAYKAGNLKSNSSQTIVTQDQNTIVIQQANPQVIYVPSYNPSVVYGAWGYPAYPPVYFPPPTGFGYGVISGIGFGVGIAITNSIWGGYDWRRHSVNVNVNRYNRINVNRPIRNSTWRHNPAYRGNRPYRSESSRQRYQSKNTNRSGLGSSNNNYRGFDKNATRNQERQRAASTMNNRGIGSSAGSRPALKNTPSRPTANRPALQNAPSRPTANRPALQNTPSRPSEKPSANWTRQNNAISGNQDSRREVRSQMNRGESSRRSMSAPDRPRQNFNRPSGGGFHRR